MKVPRPIHTALYSLMSKRNTSQIPGLGTYITFEEVLSQAPRHRDLELYMERLPELTLRFFCGLSAILHNTPYDKQRPLHFQIVRELGHDSPWSAKVTSILHADPGSMLITDEQLAVLFKYAVMHARAELWPDDGADLILRLLLIYNSLKGKEHEPRRSDLDGFMKFELRSVFNFDEQLSFVIERYSQFFRWAKTEQAHASANYLDLDQDFKRMYGFTYVEWAAAAFSILTYFRNITSVKAFDEFDPIMNTDSFLAAMTDQGPLRRWLLLNSMSLDEVRKHFVSEPGAKSYSGISLMPFLRKPLLQVRDNLFCCPYLPYLENCLGAGIFFGLLDGYNREGPGRMQSDRFTRFFGEFFEEYIVGIAQTSHPTPASVFGEREYDGGKKSTDLVIFEDDAAVFLDVTASRFNYVETLLGLNDTAIAKDMEKIVLANAAQMNKSIAAFRDGRLTFPGIDRSTITRIYPVVLSIQPLPRTFEFNRRIFAEIERRSLLASVERLEIITAEEFEGFEALFRAGVLLSDVLARKIAHDDPVARGSSFKNYMYYFERPLMQSGAPRERDDRWVDGILEVVRQWLPPEGLP